ncbi:hypothetical protein BRADI_1g49306v3 [Brachypodium distachyon]|uniref:RecA family profile 1 domain-containing protein n=1 Tax=Brachypodium distachyon TaxID=15368 RepID=A0A2K2DQI6_BRADI|nr:hypothetical protein BRADI_1g49306v3 [Brachypodium distachyon]
MPGTAAAPPFPFPRRRAVFPPPNGPKTPHKPFPLLSPPSPPMLHTTAAMLHATSPLRSLLRIHLQRIRPPNPRLARLRLLSSSSPSGGDGWATHDPLADGLFPSAVSSSAAASDPDTPGEHSDARGVFDPVSGRIVMTQQAQPQQPSRPPSSCSGGQKGKGRPSGGKGEGRWAAVAAARRSGGKAAGKARTSYVCSHCGDGFSQWWGTCRSCEAVGTLTKYVVEPDSANPEGSHHAGRSWIPQKSKEMVPQSLGDVTKGFDQAEWRIPLPGNFGNEIARVLGGGIVPGSLVLVGGDPGVGKSSLMLQLASIVSDGSEDQGSSPVVYVSGEESIEQIANRADRMSIRSRNLYLYSSTDIEDILDKIQPLSPRALIVDSIQTVYIKAFAGSAGNHMQVKECTSALLSFAKLTNIPVFLIGHVTKTGDIAGPRILEHIVDVVLYMEVGKILLPSGSFPFNVTGCHIRILAELYRLYTKYICKHQSLGAAWKCLKCKCFFVKLINTVTGLYWSTNTCV